MKTFEEFKKEVSELVAIYNSQNHWIEGEVGQTKTTIKPIFRDFSNDGYTPKYCANFIISFGENSYRTDRFFEFDLMIEKYVSGFKQAKGKFIRKNVRNAFKSIFEI